MRAQLVTGGTSQELVYEPTILTHVPASASVSHEEALAKASESRYGLCASILTGDQDRGLEPAQRLDCGMVHVNGPTMASEPSLPNGGVKGSG